MFLDYRMFLILDCDWDYLFPETRTFLVLDRVKRGGEGGFEDHCRKDAKKVFDKPNITKFEMSKNFR